MGDDPLRLRPRIVVAGGGMAGIETSLALADFTGGYAGVTVVDAARRFAVPATAAGSAFGIAPPVDLPLSQVVARAGATLRPSRLAAVDPRRRLAMLAGGELLVYDHLVIAVGGNRVARIPQALTFRGHVDVEALRGLVEGIVLHAERGGTTDLAVVIPPDCAWPLTGYEIALMAREHLVAAGQGARCEVRVLTAEDIPLAGFGAPASAAVVQALLRAMIEIVTGAAVTSFDWGQIRSADGRVHPADRVIALPEMRGPAIEGLPVDDRGFIRCDAEGRVAGALGIRVVGDAGTFPLKDGGIACRQADVAAASIARACGAEVTDPPSPATGDGVDGDLAARWPVPKVAGRFLTPFLGELAQPGALAIPR